MQAYYGFVTKYYGDLQEHLLSSLLRPGLDESGLTDTIKLHYVIESTFLMLTGITASISQQAVQHPLNKIQIIDYRSLGFLDRESPIDQSRTAVLRKYVAAYEKSSRKCLVHAQRSGGWRPWLHKGFVGNTLK